MLTYINKMDTTLILNSSQYAHIYINKMDTTPILNSSQYAHVYKQNGYNPYFQQ